MGFLQIKLIFRIIMLFSILIFNNFFFFRNLNYKYCLIEVKIINL